MQVIITQIINLESTVSKLKREKLEEVDLLFRCSSSFIVYIISYKNFNDAVLKKTQTQS